MLYYGTLWQKPETLITHAKAQALPRARKGSELPQSRAEA